MVHEDLLKEFGNLVDRLTDAAKMPHELLVGLDRWGVTYQSSYSKIENKNIAFRTANSVLEKYIQKYER